MQQSHRPTEPAAPRDWFAQVLGSIELIVRFVVTGIAVLLVYLLSITDLRSKLTWIETNLELAAVATAALGFILYITYRGIAYVVLEGLAWIFDLSGPTLFKQRPRELYASAYVTFLRWRFEPENVPQVLSGYLFTRWATVHFLNILAFALIKATLKKVHHLAA